MPEGPNRIARGARWGAAAAVAMALTATSTTNAYNSVATTAGDAWGVHDGAAPGLDTGSIRDTAGSALRGYGGLRVRVAGKLTGRSALLNGELMRGFGLRFDGVDRFTTTKSVELGGVSMTRAIRIQRSDRWARYFDTFTNTTRQSVTVEVVFGGMTGYDTGENQSEVVASSSGDATPTVADSWVAVASPTSAAGGPSFNGPSAAVIGSPGTGTMPTSFLRGAFDLPLPATGHEANHQGYGHRLRLAPGETRSLARFMVIGARERQGTGGAADAARPVAGTEVAAVTSKAADLAGDPAFGDLTTAQLCSLSNWTPEAIAAAVAGYDAAVCADIPKLDTQAAPQPQRLVTTSPYDVVGKTIGELQADMEAGRTTSQEITRAYLDRIAAYDTGQFGFHSFTWVAEDAMRQARRADQARAEGAEGALLGIPVAVKDLYDTKDMPTTNGSQVFDGFRPAQDAFQVARLRDAGVVMLGKATMAEYANSGYFSDSAWGQVWNAFEPSKSSIGSSGGSAVSLALSFTGFSLGSQTGDSLWGPASAASLFSLRGTDGMQSGSGVMPLTFTRDYAGAFTRSASDLADVLNVVTGTDPADPVTAPADDRRPEDWRTALDPGALEGMRIGYVAADFEDPFQTTGTSDAMKAQFAAFEAAGAQMVEIPAPPSSPPNTAGGDAGYEGWARWIDAHPESPYKDAAEIISSPLRLPYSRRGPYTGSGRMTQSQVDAQYTQRAEYQRRLAGWMDLHDVAAVAYAGLLSDVGLNDGITPSFGRVDPPSSSSGAPTIIFPAGVNDHGEPINLQLLGRAWDDAKLLGYAYAFDRVANGHVEPDTAPALEYEPGAPLPPIEIEKPAEPVTTAPVADPDTNTSPAPAAPAPAPPAAGTPAAATERAARRMKPRRIAAKARWLKPGRRVRVSGRVLLPAGASRAEACGGRVRVVVRAGSKAIRRQRTAVTAGCRFRATVTVRTSRARVRVAVRYLGSPALAPRSATSRSLRIRR
jgi:amidase